MLKRFNLSEWALRHQGFVLYCIVALGLIGAFSYERLGQSEDPPFTFKVMVVRTQWPGATAREVEQQITEKLERKLQETPNVDFLRSYSRPGESQIFVIAKDTAPSNEMGEMFYQVRKKVGDIRNTLPDGVRGPFFNDEFGDTFGNIFALTGDGYTYAELKEHAERLRRDLLRLPDAAKVDLMGEQDEKIYVEMSNTKLATLGVDVATILGILQQQNSMVPAGSFETPTDKIFLRVSGDFDSVESVRELAIRGNNRTFRLGDINGDLQADTVVKQLDSGISTLRAQLLPGYRLEMGGAVEESAKGGSSIVAGVPLLFFGVLTVLMIQLQSFQRVIIVVLTAPLGLIGVTIFLLAFNKPFGFVAMLGTIALSGMIMRNSVILIDQIEQDIAAGHPAWNAIIDSTVRRFRPIVLTALAAILAMIPLTRSVFFGPMAVAIMGGLFVATVLTLLFLPALYAAWFRVRKTEAAGI